ncbi:MAG: general secretion pathway protein GspK [Candidatus Solibacter usitatus]|nr:general secretion pathway protein GspK [Candidatus Solibacter usitatus]
MAIRGPFRHRVFRCHHGAWGTGTVLHRLGWNTSLLSGAGGRSTRLALGLLGEQYRNPDGTPRYWAPGRTRLRFEFPNGVAEVDFMPESSKLNVNTGNPVEIFRLIVALGVEPEQARVITAAIVDWRSQPPRLPSPFDMLYLAQTPSFRARHASLEETEELLLVRGVTPELFHGSYARDEEGRLYPRPGLKDCLSVFSNGQQVDANFAQPAVLAAIGLPPQAIAAIVQRRPFPNMQMMQMLASQFGPAAGRLSIATSSITTFRATATLRIQGGQLSDLRRTVSAVVKFVDKATDSPWHILRWSDQGTGALQ